MADTAIEWSDAAWNPLAGCSRVSAGCTRCYAERFAHRLAAMGQEKYRGLTRRVGNEVRWTGEVRLVEEALALPLRWRRPRRIFVNSMSDLFHEKVPDEWIWQVYGVMSAARQHTFQVLTKRPERMRRVVTEITGAKIPCPNVWLGVSVEDPAALWRLDALRETPAEVRFASFEPLLEDLGRLNLAGIGWAIFGGESGPGARWCFLEWIRRGVAECRRQGVAPFVKQVGSRPVGPPRDPANPYLHGEVLNLRDRKGGDWLEWPEDLRVREYPAVPTET